MKILERNLNRNTFVVWEMKWNVSVVRFKFRCNILLSGKIINVLKPTGFVMHQQFNIQQLYALSTLYLCFVFIWEQTATCATYSIN